MATEKGLKISESELELLNSKIGLRNLFTNKQIDIEKSLRAVAYETELRKKQAELVKLQSWAIENDKKIVILFEGRDAAGKGGAISGQLAENGLTNVHRHPVKAVGRVFGA